MIGCRFTIRDVLCVTATIALALGMFVNLPHLASAVSKIYDGVWQQAAQIGVPLMGRESVPPQW
jgi:hypothetical protein